ncbi:MAG: hypothetical protein GWN07_35620, partial [Actinobacteria bacterium]|nr:carbohydrate binding family 9 domain-containing protein [Actinomycetota bacterium]NIS36181.1 carbohydrate binding family 9 domain-containing protein [Actinomycetota bacterium]NIU70751.1 carbohydrate binding family 9 domain-containing protein [Actinomycetota bacterium]NIW32656.1 hypothetical protein [Actinomycetota bacterium]NIX24849.1 hypothetical protein [Actinomycetota bacterium]
RLVATRITGASPVVDGALDDSAWTAAEPATGFVQFEPEPGAPATERTEARILYDDEAVYVGVRLFDSRPDSVTGHLFRRDEEGYSDWVYVALDTRRDRRTAFTFGVNPRGVKWDAFLYDDTRVDRSWDAIWDAASR